jgi:ribosomal protein S18 acetylase RimI-like enzyme
MAHSGEPHVELRAFDPSRDLEAARRVVAAAFGHSHWPFFEDADPALTRDFVELLVGYGSHPLVAVTNNEVAGVLLGTHGPGAARLPGAARVVARLLRRIATNEYHAGPRARRFLADVVRTWTPVVVRTSPHAGPQGEALLFAVHPERQRMGLGKALMDRFVATAADAGLPRLVLLTDTTMSWQFYEAYGYRRVSALSLGDCYRVSLPQHRATAFLYALDLDRSAPR